MLSFETRMKSTAAASGIVCGMSFMCELCVSALVTHLSACLLQHLHLKDGLCECKNVCGVEIEAASNNAMIMHSLMGARATSTKHFCHSNLFLALILPCFLQE
jgi:hypothetical protein